MYSNVSILFFACLRKRSSRNGKKLPTATFQKPTSAWSSSIIVAPTNLRSLGQLSFRASIHPRICFVKSKPNFEIEQVCAYRDAVTRADCLLGSKGFIYASGTIHHICCSVAPLDMRANYGVGALNAIILYSRVDTMGSDINSAQRVTTPS